MDEAAPLVKPAAVPEPDQDAHEKKIAKIKEEIDEGEKKVTEITEEVEKCKEQRGAHDGAMNEVKAELRANRDKIRDTSKDRDRIMEDLKKMTETIKSQNQKAEKIRKELKVSDSSEIDTKVAELTNQLETCSMDLKSEKEIVNTIKKLTADKDKVREYEAEREAVKSKREEHDALFARRQALGEEMTALRDQEKVLQAKLEAMRGGEGAPSGVNPAARVNELFEQKAKVVEGIKGKRNELKEANIQFRVKVAEFKEYQRALQSFERKVDRIEFQRRRAEQVERNEAFKAEKKERDKQRKEQRKRIEARMAAVAAGCQLFIGGLALRATEEELKAHFVSYGEVTDVFVLIDNETQLSRGFGFITFKTREEADAAIKEVHGQEVKGLCTQHGRLNVKLAEKSKAQKEWEKA